MKFIEVIAMVTSVLAAASNDPNNGSGQDGGYIEKPSDLKTDNGSVSNDTTEKKEQEKEPEDNDLKLPEVETEKDNSQKELGELPSDDPTQSTIQDGQINDKSFETGSNVVASTPGSNVISDIEKQEDVTGLNKKINNDGGAPISPPSPSLLNSEERTPNNSMIPNDDNSNLQSNRAPEDVTSSPAEPTNADTGISHGSQGNTTKPEEVNTTESSGTSASPNGEDGKDKKKKTKKIVEEIDMKKYLIYGVLGLAVFVFVISIFMMASSK